MKKREINIITEILSGVYYDLYIKQNQWNIHWGNEAIQSQVTA